MLHNYSEDDEKSQMMKTEVGKTENDPIDYVLYG